MFLVSCNIILCEMDSVRHCQWERGVEHVLESLDSMFAGVKEPIQFGFPAPTVGFTEDVLKKI